MNFLWTEQYRPDDFNNLDFHEETNKYLQNVSSSENMPHMIIYGPSGAGKYTRVLCMLKNLYGKSLKQTQKDVFRVKHKSKEISANVKYSKNHIEIVLSDLKNQDQIVLNKFLKDVATNQSVLDMNKKSSFTTIVLHQANKLSHGAQAALRRNLEKYTEKIRLIMICESSVNIISAIKSRCLQMRVKSPSILNIKTVLENIAKQENFNDKKINSFIETISQNSDNNLRQAILSLQNKYLNPEYNLQNLNPAWKKIISEQIVKKIMNKQDTIVIKECRKVFYDLMANNISADNIIVAVLEDLLLKVEMRNQSMKLKEIATQIDVQLKQGRNSIIYLESFLVKCLLVLKNNQLKFQQEIIQI